MVTYTMWHNGPINTAAAVWDLYETDDVDLRDEVRAPERAYRTTP